VKKSEGGLLGIFGGKDKSEKSEKGEKSEKSEKSEGGLLGIFKPKDKSEKSEKDKGVFGFLGLSTIIEPSKNLVPISSEVFNAKATYIEVPTGDALSEKGGDIMSGLKKMRKFGKVSKAEKFQLDKLRRAWVGVYGPGNIPPKFLPKKEKKKKKKRNLLQKKKKNLEQKGKEKQQKNQKRQRNPKQPTKRRNRKHQRSQKRKKRKVFSDYFLLKRRKMTKGLRKLKHRNNRMNQNL